jgi:hypothetical protein
MKDILRLQKCGIPEVDAINVLRVENRISYNPNHHEVAYYIEIPKEPMTGTNSDGTMITGAFQYNEMIKQLQKELQESNDRNNELLKEMLECRSNIRNYEYLLDEIDKWILKLGGHR